jgi:signal peptidase I
VGEARPTAGSPEDRLRTPSPIQEDRPAATTEKEASQDGPGRHRKKKEEERRGFLGFLRELPGLILIAFLLALLIKTFLIQAFFIPSESMLPTLEIGDRVLVNKVVYDIGEVQRGDIVVFRNPHLQEPDRGPVQAFLDWLVEGLGFSSDPDRDFIKRVIGLPGETVEVRNGRVYIDGDRLREPYVIDQEDPSDYGPVTVPAGKYFVMGDNRPNSSDSRSPTLGFIPEDRIVGKAFVLLWPPPRVEWLSDD